MPTRAAVAWSRAQSSAGGFDLRKYTAPYGNTDPIATSFTPAGSCANASVPSPIPGNPAPRPTAADRTHQRRRPHKVPPRNLQVFLHLAAAAYGRLEVIHFTASSSVLFGRRL